MRLSMLPIVERTSLARKRLIADLQAMAAGKFRITIDGEPQDGAMHSAALASIESELRGRLASLERDLVSYGVVLDVTELRSRSPIQV